jgi:hypothetical protein
LSFPELRRVFSGYLHEDVLAEAGTPEAAMRTFWTEADAGERRRFQREATHFLSHIATLSFDEVRDLLEQLGSRWMPPTRESLIALLTGVADAPPRS